MTEPIHEIALTPDEVREILAQCGPHALLVGGQALALWAAVYEVTPPKVLAASISSDADFIGNAALAYSAAGARCQPLPLCRERRLRRLCKHLRLRSNSQNFFTDREKSVAERVTPGRPGQHHGSDQQSELILDPLDIGIADRGVRMLTRHI